MRRAFTLVELLVVVAIIGILAAIAVPNYLRAKMRAEKSQCAGNLHTLGQALALYRIDYNAYPPADGMAGPDASPGKTVVGEGPAANGSWDGISRLLLDLQYVTEETALYCPTLRKRYPKRQEYYRYAYNSSAIDTGGTLGGANDLARENGQLWLVRCLWVPSEHSFQNGSGVVYPHGDEVLEEVIHRDVMENVLMTDLAVHERNGKRDFRESFRMIYP